MIKKLYCYQGLCPYQCIVTISHNTNFNMLPHCLLFDYDPIWKEESYVEGLDGKD